LKNQSLTKIIGVVGPTASGKTQLALNLAENLGGEIICTDSMQVYKGMDIGTAKPTAQEQQQIPHHQLDLVFPDEHYSAGKYVRDTAPIIEDITQRGKIPILVGGSGLYYRALIYGMSPMPEISDKIQKQVNDWLEKEGLSYCWQRLQELDSSGASVLHPNDRCRILRALEVVLASGKPISYFRKQQSFASEHYQTHLVGYTRERKALYARINERTLLMLKSGWIEETQKLLQYYSDAITPLHAIGYKQILQFLSEQMSHEHMVEKIQQKTRNYAKRQLTWFRKDSEIHWYATNELSALLSETTRFIENKNSGKTHE